MKEENENIIEDNVEMKINNLFDDIKDKLKEDYSFSNNIWSDNILKSKINDYLNDELKEKLLKDNDEFIERICELIGEDLLEL